MRVFWVRIYYYLCPPFEDWTDSGLLPVAGYNVGLSRFGRNRLQHWCNYGTTNSFHSFVVWKRYPFSSPVSFELLNLAFFFWILSFSRDSTVIYWCLFVFRQYVLRIILVIMLRRPLTQGRKRRPNLSIYISQTALSSNGFPLSPFFPRKVTTFGNYYVEAYTLSKRPVQILCVPFFLQW